MITPANFHTYLQQNISRLSIDISVLRNQSKPNTVTRCRQFCAAIVLDKFFDSLKGNYAEYLNEQTDLLLGYCKKEELKFGSARKVLNIFFRHICYNGFFQQKYLRGLDLLSSESLLAKLELPIDSKVVNHLRRGAKKDYNWTIKGLSAVEHEKYQLIGKQIGDERKLARIHLDLEFWTESNDKINESNGL